MKTKAKNILVFKGTRKQLLSLLYDMLEETSPGKGCKRFFIRESSALKNDKDSDDKIYIGTFKKI